METRNFSALSLFILLTAVSAYAGGDALAWKTKDIYHDGWIDFNKNGVKDPYEDPSLDIEKRIDDLLKRMTIEEKTCQLATLYGYRKVLKDPLPTPEWKKSLWKDGIANIDEHLNGFGGGKREYNATPHRIAESLNLTQRFFVEETRLGIPVDFTNEGIHGLCARNATNFPVQLGQGSTWDKELVREIGKVVGEEAKSLGYTNIYAPILDLARDPRWGRIVESYGESPYLVSVLGMEMVLGIQECGRASSPKHFAVYSIPKGGRDGMCRTNPHVSRREMETLFLAPFKAAFTKGHAWGTMVSFNTYDGIPVSASAFFLKDLLRKKWGFKGYVVSDSGAVDWIRGQHHVATSFKEAVMKAVNAGMNVRTNFTPPGRYVRPLRELVAEGKVAMETIDFLVRGVLRVKFAVGLFDNPYVDSPAAADGILNSPEHDALSKRTSLESIVLLKNEGGILPLNLEKTSKIAVIGPNAMAKNGMRGRYGPAGAKVISVLEGIRGLVGDNAKVEYERGCAVTDAHWPASEIFPFEMTDAEKAEIAKAVALARRCDVAIVVLGGSAKTVGESKSRTSLQLPGRQRQLIRAVQGTGTPTVVVLINGRPLAINWVDKHVPGIIEAWFPGTHCGDSVAEVLFGAYNPGGKLSVTFPRCVGQIPFNFPSKPHAQAGQGGRKGPDGYGMTRILGALYPFGHGLSYTTFEYSGMKLSSNKIKAGEILAVSCDVTNTGKRAGDEVVQLYLSDLVASVSPYEKVLRGFKRIHLDPGETKNVSFTLTSEDMSMLGRDMEWVVEPGDFEVSFGTSSATKDTRLKRRFRVVAP